MTALRRKASRKAAFRAHCRRALVPPPLVLAEARGDAWAGFAAAIEAVLAAGERFLRELAAAWSHAFGAVGSHGGTGR